MTDKPRPPSERLDEAIERTARAIMRQDAPATLRARVLARLSAAASLRSQRVEAGVSRPSVRLKAGHTPVVHRTSQRVAWAGAMLAFVIAAAFVASRWWTNPAVLPSQTAADVTAARPAPPSAEPTPPPIAASAAMSDRPVVRVAAAADEAVELAMPERPPFVDPLPPPDPIAIAPLETERVTPDVVEIEPLTLDVMTIEPIHIQR
jgi:hypothetical protein